MKNEFLRIVALAFEKEIIKKIVFSKPKATEISKVSGRMCAHRGQKILALEYSLPGNTVSHKNVRQGELSEVISELLCGYSQANLITTLGDAEWKTAKRGEIILGGDSLVRKMSGAKPKFESAIEALDKKKSRMLDGNEDFLIKLGISDSCGRVHDKRQAKFRQICRFLEHIEEIYSELPKDGPLKVYDLCCGKSYLSFAVYHYLVNMRGREVTLIGVDLKRDVISWCESTAHTLGFSGMKFIYDDITNIDKTESVDMVISLHACDVATDIVLDTAAKLGARVILSTPCCHRYLNGKIKNENLEFVTRYPQLSVKLCEAFTDAIRLARLKAYGYEVLAKELTDPENTPKNTLLVAVKKDISDSKRQEYKAEYDSILSFLLGDKKDEYLADI